MDDKGKCARLIAREHEVSRSFEKMIVLHLESFMDLQNGIIKDMIIN